MDRLPAEQEPALRVMTICPPTPTRTANIFGGWDQSHVDHSRRAFSPGSHGARPRARYRSPEKESYSSSRDSHESAHVFPSSDYLVRFESGTPEIQRVTRTRCTAETAGPRTRSSKGVTEATPHLTSAIDSEAADAPGYRRRSRLLLDAPHSRLRHSARARRICIGGLGNGLRHPDVHHRLGRLPAVSAVQSARSRVLAVAGVIINAWELCYTRAPSIARSRWIQ